MKQKFFTALILVAAFSSFAFGAEADKVVARVASQDITEREVLDFIKPFGQQAMMLYSSEDGKKMIINDVISMRLFALKAQEEKMDETPDFKETLENTKRAMLAQAAMRDLVKDIVIKDDDAQKFYDENPKLFVQPERVHARHILVSDDETLEKVQAELKAGKSFDVVAKEFSIDPGSAANGGDLGEFPKGVMVKEFEETAFALKNPGDVSEPVKTQFGWHIIKLEERIAESTTPFAQVKQQILQELREQKTQEILETKSKELEEKYKVERF